MFFVQVIKVYKREYGGLHSMRSVGKLPAVIYGKNRPATKLYVEEKELSTYLGSRHADSVLDISLDNKRIKVVVKNLQYHPLKNHLLHLDFIEISKSSTVSLRVLIKFLNPSSSPGLKIGGSLNIVNRSVRVSTSTDSIPSFFTIDLSGANIGHTFKIKDLKLDKDITCKLNDNQTIATIVKGRVSE